jgi:hypothetical protein
LCPVAVANAEDCRFLSDSDVDFRLHPTGARRVMRVLVNEFARISGYNGRFFMPFEYG